MKLVLCLAAALLLCSAARSQASEAISSYAGGSSYVGYTFGGTGFAFSPKTDMRLTSLGYSGVDLANEAYQVSLWDTNGLVLATAALTTNAPFRNLTYYHAVAPVNLLGGATYYISAVGLTNGAWSGNVITSPGNGNFTVAPDIQYLASASGTNTAGGFPSLLQDPSFYFVGANFEYSLKPVIVLTGISVSNALAHVSFNVTSDSASSFTLLSSAMVNGPWSTNSTATLATNQPGVSYTFATHATNPAQFYRVQTP